MFNKEEKEKGFDFACTEDFVTPKKDFRIVCDKHDIILKEGEKIKVPKQFIQNLKTEGVI